MKHKVLLSFIPALGLVGVLGASAAYGRGFGGFRNLTPDEIVSQQQTMFQKEAGILGIGVDDVKNAWAEGKTLWQIAEEKGISQEQLNARIKESQIKELKLRLQTLADKGVISQAQADKRLQAMQKKIDNKKSRGGMRIHGMF